MEGNDDQNLKAINSSVGRLVWVRLRNGSWWPGQTLLHEEVPQNSLVSPKPGTPIKLLGREDVGIEWYILEKSKSVKAFRCGEYDAHIEKAKASAAAARASSKKTVKCTRREIGINTALEIENAHLAEEHHPDDNLRGSSGEEEDDEVTESDEELDSAPEILQSSMSSQNVGALLKVEPKRRRTPNDSEEDGTEGTTKRMRGLEDIGKEHVGGAIVLHRQEMGSVCDVNLIDSVTNGYVVNKVCSPLSLKRKRSQVANGDECSKRKNRRRQLTKVLETTAMVCVPGTSDQLVTSGLEPVESMRSVSVVINNNSDSTGVSCENAPENVVGASHNNKVKDSETSSLSVSAEDDSSEQLYDVPLTGEAEHYAACTMSSSRTGLVSCLTRRCGRSYHDLFVKKEANNGCACANPLDTQQLVIWNRNGIEKSTSKWKIKGKRNSRQMSKKQEARRSVFGEEANNNNNVPLLLPALFDVKIEVIASCNKPRVPLVSRMSKLNGKAIVGHPVSVEALEESYYNGGMVMPQAVVKAKPLSKEKGKKRKTNGAFGKSKKKSSSLSVKTRRLSTLTESKKPTIEKLKETVVACIPLKVVFSRINQVLKGSARHTQHRPLPSTAKT